MAQCSHVVKGARKVEVKGSLHDKNQFDRPGRFSSCVAQGCICQISLGGSKFWLLKSTTVLMHRYIESRPPLRFFNSSRGGQKFSRGEGFNPQPPDKYSPD